MGKRVLALALILALGAVVESPAVLLLAQKDALALAFPTAALVEKKTAFLSKEQLAAAQKRARVKIESAVWTYYVGRSTNGTLGYAYFDRTIVRTLPAAVMVALGAAGKVRFVEILTFNEPKDYLPRRRWLKLFNGRILDKELRVRAAIGNVSGATLTSHAVTDSVRRILAVHKEVHRP